MECALTSLVRTEFDMLWCMSVSVVSWCLDVPSRGDISMFAIVIC